MDRDPRYTVIMRGEEFTLTQSQIEVDSPNYFTQCFLGDFREAQTRRLQLSRNPDLFRIVVEHLCGYQVLPLDVDHLPARMTPESALVNLRADASFYLLQGLVEACDALIQPSPDGISSNVRYLVLSCEFTVAQSLNFSTMIDQAFHQSARHWYTYIGQSQLDGGPLATLERAESVTDFEGIRRKGEIERLVNERLRGYGLGNDFRLVGWHIRNLNPDFYSRVTQEIMVVLQQ